METRCGFRPPDGDGVPWRSRACDGVPGWRRPRCSRQKNHGRESVPSERSRIESESAAPLVEAGNLPRQAQDRLARHLDAGMVRGLCQEAAEILERRTETFKPLV